VHDSIKEQRKYQIHTPHTIAAIYTHIQQANTHLKGYLCTGVAPSASAISASGNGENAAAAAASLLELKEEEEACEACVGEREKVDEEEGVVIVDAVANVAAAIGAFIEESRADALDTEVAVVVLTAA